MRTDEASLHMLMVRSMGGNAAAYRELLVGTQHWLARYFGRKVMPTQIDDLVQETLISLHTKRASFDIDRPFLPWVAAIARYRWIDMLRKTTRAGEVELTDTFGVDAGDELVEASLSLTRLLQKLKPEQARVIQLVKIEGMSIAEAAETTGQSEALVKVNIHRGIRRMSMLIESE